MSKVPAGAPSEVQQSFREVWESLDPFLRTNINLSGRRFINAGNARAGGDYVTQRQITDQFGFEAFYDELKERGLDGFPGRLSDPQEAVAAAYPDPPPTTHAIGQIYYAVATGELKVVTESGVVTVTANSLMGLSDTDFSSPITGDSVYYDTTSGKWKNNPNIKLYSDGYISIYRSTGAWFQATASAQDAGMICNLPSQTWIAFGTTTHFKIKDETAGLEALAFAKTTGLATFTSTVNGTVGQFNTSGLGAIVKVATSATDGYAGFRMANDAREWAMQVRTLDTFSIQDITAGSLVRFQIDTAGAVKISPGPLSIEHTQPRLTFTDTTAGAHDAYLQMDSDIFQINVDGDSNLTCGKTYTGLWQEVTIAGANKKLAFFGGTRQLKTTVAGSRAGNAALAALLTALHDYGLITDSTT